MATKTSMDKFQRFEAWLRQHGAQFDNLELREYDADISAMALAAQDAAEEKKDATNTTMQEQEESEMRGVHAIRHVPANTVCMSIPRKCLITVEMGQATPLGQAILKSNLDLDAPKHIFLMIYILWDRKVKGVKSFFHPYYEILPQTLRNMPIFWSRQELSYLQGSHLLSQIADRNEAIAQDYDAIFQACGPQLTQLCTLQEFKWARMCVCSRNFGLLMDGHRTSALVPHADMLNHYRPRETKWTFDEEKQAFTITSLQAIPAGAQVYDSYGQKCNHRFLLNYGFAVEDNRELDGFCPNEVPIELTVAEDDPLYHDKVEFWTRGEANSLAAAVAAVAARNATASQLHSAIEAVVRKEEENNNIATRECPAKRVRVCVSNNENTRLLFSLLRALACNREELAAISSSLSDSSAVMSRALFGLSTSEHEAPSHEAAAPPRTGSLHGGKPSAFYRSCRDVRHPISLRNERAAMLLLMDVLQEALQRYPTTLAQDVADLLDEVAFPRFSNKRHAKIQVRGEKEVLQHFMTWAQTALHVISIIEQELQVELASPGNSNNGVSSFDYVVREMEDEEGVGAGLHHTIVRYCTDVLGSLRREELKNTSLQRLDMMSTA